MSAALDANALLDALAAAIAAKLGAANEPAPRWRTLAAEAARRGFPSPRALRDWCKAANVAVRGSGKHQVVSLADLDAALERMPVRDAAPPHAPKKPERTSPRSLDRALANAGLRVVAGGGKGAR